MPFIPFQKTSGAGNTFVVIDGRNLPPAIDLAALAREACSAATPHGGADGLIVVAQSEQNDFEMLYYNRDGSTGMMCGNGGRCAVRFAADHGYVNDPAALHFSNAGVGYTAALSPSGVRIDFPDPLEIRLHETIEIDGLSIPHSFIDVGTPHVILQTTEIPEFATVKFRDIDVATWGSRIRNHPDFVERGVNVNFVRPLPEGNGIGLRTYERGVEAETGACGTGAIASAIASVLLAGMSAPVRVVPTSGDALSVDFTIGGEESISNVSLEGPAEVIAEGTLSPEWLAAGQS